MREPSFEFWSIVALAVATAIVLVFSVRKLAAKIFDEPSPPSDAGADASRTRAAQPASPPDPAWEDARCLACGDVASEPMPSLERSRGARDWLRELFAMPPRYRRVVRADRPTLCRSHAHVADAMVDEFIHNRVRGAFTAAYTRVAVEAAGFEKEFLQKQLTESLTDDQKKAAKRAGATVTRLVRTADGNGSSG